MLNIIGLGLGDEKDITLNALEAIKDSSKIYLENYTSRLNCSIEDLEKLYGKRIILADRNLVESKADDTILKESKNENVSFLVVGDIFGATTHSDIVLRAKKAGIVVRYFHNASIMNAVGVTGLELYKFGKTTSMPFFDKGYEPASAYETIFDNLRNDLHTLVLLDIKVAEPSKKDLLRGIDKPQPPRFMTVAECLNQLLELESRFKNGIFYGDTKVIGCARIGSKDFVIRYGKINDLLEFDFGNELHCVIIPGNLHFHEEEFLEQYRLE